MSYITEGFQSVGYFPTPHFGIAIYPPSLGNVCTLRVQLHNLIINHPEKKKKNSTTAIAVRWHLAMLRC